MDKTEWALKIVEVYMTWYTFFVTTNFAVLGYLFAKDARSLDSRAIRLLAVVFVIFNISGIGSTILVGGAAASSAPKEFQWLIHWATGANTVGLFGNTLLWCYIIFSRWWQQTR